VWKFATKVNDSEAKCNICKNTYKTPGGNTSNIRNHIIIKHANTEEGKELNLLTTNKKTAAEKKKKLKVEEKNSIKIFYPTDRVISVATKEIIDDSFVEYFIACNESFSQTENPFFRKMCFKMNSGYTLGSRRELGRQIDAKIVKIKEDLVKEMSEDIKSHQSIHITSDGGSSGDQNKTKKNTLTVSRITDDFEMKRDTIAVAEALRPVTS